MRIVDQEGHEVVDPDLDLGHLDPGKLLVEHHDEVPYEPAEYENQLVTEYDNGGKLYKRVCVKLAVEGVAAWDEYEDVLVYVPYTPEELEEIRRQNEEAEKAKQEAEEAAKRAEEERVTSERVNLAVRSLSAMIMPTMTFADISTSKIANLSPFYDEWSDAGVSYAKGTPFTYTVDDSVRYFRASQNTVSTAIYKPGDAGTESIYYEFFIAPDGYEIYQPCKGEYNAYSFGDVVHYPNADSPLYESVVPGNNSNAYSPDTVPDNWRKVE